jgi:hypothetical protein
MFIKMTNGSHDAAEVAFIFRNARARHLRHTLPMPKAKDADKATRGAALAKSVDDMIAARTIDELVADLAKLFSDPERFKAQCSLSAKNFEKAQLREQKAILAA